MMSRFPAHAKNLALRRKRDAIVKDLASTGYVVFRVDNPRRIE